jgi:hypothetical protein
MMIVVLCDVMTETVMAVGAVVTVMAGAAGTVTIEGGAMITGVPHPGTTAVGIAVVMITRVAVDVMILVEVGVVMTGEARGMRIEGVDLPVAVMAVEEGRFGGGGRWLGCEGCGYVD